jgi:hypothetical protein
MGVTARFRKSPGCWKARFFEGGHIRRSHGAFSRSSSGACLRASRSRSVLMRTVSLRAWSIRVHPRRSASCSRNSQGLGPPAEPVDNPGAIYLMAGFRLMLYLPVDAALIVLLRRTVRPGRRLSHPRHCVWYRNLQPSLFSVRKTGIRGSEPSSWSRLSENGPADDPDAEEEEVCA